VIVNELDVVRIAILPPETDAPLIIDANAVLSRAIAFEFLQPIAWRRPEIVERFGGI
jgi:hypothetical protein